MFGGRVYYDSLNRLTRRDTRLQTERALYTYDAAGQLVNACATVVGGCAGDYGTLAAAVARYQYDSAGSRTDAAAAAIVARGNRTLRFKGDTLTYDADGNVLTKVGHGKSWAYTWDAFDRLTQVYESGVLIDSYDYDAFDRRVARAGAAPCSYEQHVYDGDQFAFALDCYGQLKDEFGWYPGTDQPLGVKFAGRSGVIMTDPKLGASVSGVATSDGLYSPGPVIKAYNTTAWGESAADTGAMFRLRMAGQQYDQQTGLYYMRARFYDPGLGRFMSEDPIGIEGGLNLYTYAGNDPINGWDPDGTDPQNPDCVTKEGLPGIGDPNHPAACIPKTPVQLDPVWVTSSGWSVHYDPFNPVPWALGVPASGTGPQQAGQWEKICLIFCLSGANAQRAKSWAQAIDNVGETFQEAGSSLTKNATKLGATEEQGNVRILLRWGKVAGEIFSAVGTRIFPSIIGCVGCGHPEAWQPAYSRRAGMHSGA